MALPVVGALLVFSLMIAPPAIARALTDRPGFAVFLSIAIALFTIWSAIALSYVTDWPIGFFVGTMGAILYGLERFINTARLSATVTGFGRRRTLSR